MSRRASAREAGDQATLVKRLAEVAAVAIFAVQLWMLVGRISASIEGPGDVLWMIPAAFLGVLFTDFISGLVHWLCDTFGTEDTPILGHLLIGPFREHHRDPLAMTRRGLLRINHANCVGIVAVLGVCLWLTQPGPGESSSVFGQTFLFSFACAVYLTNTIHQWAHQPRAPAVARGLQRLGLVIGPAHHAPHHVAGRGSYCITTGWLNPLLDRGRVFLALERTVAAIHARNRRVTPRDVGQPRRPGGVRRRRRPAPDPAAGEQPRPKGRRHRVAGTRPLQLRSSRLGAARVVRAGASVAGYVTS